MMQIQCMGPEDRSLTVLIHDKTSETTLIKPSASKGDG